MRNFWDIEVLLLVNAKVISYRQSGNPYCYSLFLIVCVCVCVCVCNVSVTNKYSSWLLFLLVSRFFFIHIFFLQILGGGECFILDNCETYSSLVCHVPFNCAINKTEPTPSKCKSFYQPKTWQWLKCCYWLFVFVFKSKAVFDHTKRREVEGGKQWSIQLHWGM